MRKQKEIDLTNGEILPNLVRFMLPVLAGQLFQTLYNSVDSVVVGNFVGTNALAAVTASSSITMFFVGFFTGLATGASVVFAMHFGAKEYENLSNDIHTAMTFSIGLGILVAAAGILFVPQLLSLVSCPSDVYDDVLIYLRIYMVGIFFMSLYNVGAAVLRSVGDSQSPFYYLLTSSCMNIVLDVVFVALIGMGVAGVAIATVISQLISVCLTFRKMMMMDPAYRFSFRQMHIDFQILKKL
ncbi:MAG: polysaccharide biosynthesis C-terminal domain-containing protein [Lachnospiraceae bacterium]|nr:polysaccharide biosynthesis C-terminal domain-containing protein [Lachnospiraceae bacterium]